MTNRPKGTLVVKIMHFKVLIKCHKGPTKIINFSKQAQVIWEMLTECSHTLMEYG